MREVKEKSPLKERTVETLKSAPQAASRRGTDASLQQLRQELRDAAQDGQPEDRYESSKITDTADHAVREVSHLTEKVVHKLPKTKSEQQREAGQNLFHNTNVRSPSILLRNRGNIHYKANHREISLCANRLLQLGRSRFLRQAATSLKYGSIHRLLMHPYSSPSIQLRKFMKSRRSFPVHR